jgi:hypothetical protein
VIANAQRSGPAGDIQYFIEVATDASMTNKSISVLVNEGTTQTVYTAADDLAYGTRYYWHVRASDPGHQSPFSGTQSFVTPAAPVVVTPPSPGPGPIVTPAANDGINMSQATILNSPFDLASWPATGAISLLDLRPSGVHIEFTKQDGPDRWPDVVPPGWAGSLQYTLGMCLNINSRWYCSAVVEYWHGLDAAGGAPNDYAMNWFYSPERWAPMTGHQPAVGETIGFFACAGDCRNNTAGSLSPVKERTNIVLVPMPGSGGATFRF